MGAEVLKFVTSLWILSFSNNRFTINRSLLQIEGMGVQKTLCSERGSIFVFFIDNLAENIGLIPEFCDVFIAIMILLYALFSTFTQRNCLFTEALSISLINSSVSKSHVKTIRCIFKTCFLLKQFSEQFPG